MQSEKMDSARRSVEYPPRSPDLTPLDFYLWSDLENTVCIKQPRTLQDLRHKVEVASVAITPATMRGVYNSVACYHQQCTEAGGGHFEHL
jgi:hypothetical protein